MFLLRFFYAEINDSLDKWLQRVRNLFNAVLILRSIKLSNSRGSEWNKGFLVMQGVYEVSLRPDKRRKWTLCGTC